ncbi:HAMP domain-containing sensor histidine kinase [Acidovorax sp. NCPPB 4044]|uniref:HAMP domain-containing sensor histidine kinase n=1 Tax=Acidovorax sp. NCPPB 4044 TaxID=2940490 RepID=UPI0023034372|nr:ATP-binding protein [Acidovorax sp. NCPPB 4044]MDA8523047.1 ATP-binding protein [Acidovorax sp. NCPPB 4044]
MSNPFSRRLYLRIWLAVVGGVAVLTLAVGWAWRIASEQNALSQPAPPPREIVLLDPAGQPVLRGLAIRVPPSEGGPPEGLEFRVEAEGAELPYTLQFSPRMRPPGHDRRGGPEAAFWTRPPFGFLWLLGLVGVAVAVGVFPIIRRLLKRLENLQRGVQRFGEGDLSVRVAEHGLDEVADLSRQFNAAAARIETLVKSHKSLLANASHELRSPLTRIRMGLELMQGSTPSPAFREEILRNIAELDQLVDEILLASRLDAREADMGTVEAVELLGLAAEECVRVDAELDAGMGSDALEVQGVAKLLRRALRNLLENARRYSQGEITVHLQRAGGHAEVRVCDHGPGVPPAQRERIFEPFYRLPGASERAGGVGLGLSLVRSIAERHGGSVRCEDRPDGQSGACFVLSLPLAGAPAPQAGIPALHAPPIPPVP